MIDIDKFRSMLNGYFSDVVKYPDVNIESAYYLAEDIEGQLIACWPTAKRDRAIYYLTAHYLLAVLTPEGSSTFNPSYGSSVGVADSVSIGTITVSKSNKVTSDMGLNDQEYSKSVPFGKLFLQIKDSVRPNVFKVITKRSCGC